MGCPALGIWVGFFKQPALPGEAHQKKNSSKKFLKNKNHYCLVSLMWMKIGSNDITAQVPGVS
jgi:hypothetical protein